jgi:hypothetical protein
MVSLTRIVSTMLNEIKCMKGMCGIKFSALVEDALCYENKRKTANGINLSISASFLSRQKYLDPQSTH